MIVTNKYNPSQVYKMYDPTRTLTLRNAFVKNMERRFNELISVIKKTIVENDAFGLLPGIQTHEMVPAGWQAFNYKMSQEKIIKFMEWLQQQVDSGILDIKVFEQAGTAINSAWTNLYVADSYKRGVIRARYELQKLGLDIPSIEDTGGISMAMTNPFHVDRLGIIFTRTYTDLKGITAAMDMQISRVLAQGIADGDGPALLARKLVAVINGQGIGDLAIKDTLGRFIPAKVRAEMLARTEIIRAHHLATIQEYRNWAVFNVMVEAEVVTAGDDRVCPVCDALAAGGPYTLDQIENMIPAHTRCRCIALPIIIN